jgi:hypothetical protein
MHSSSSPSLASSALSRSPDRQLASPRPLPDRTCCSRRSPSSERRTTTSRAVDRSPFSAPHETRRTRSRDGSRRSATAGSWIWKTEVCRAGPSSSDGAKANHAAALADRARRLAEKATACALQSILQDRVPARVRAPGWNSIECGAVFPSRLSCDLYAARWGPSRSDSGESAPPIVPRPRINCRWGRRAPKTPQQPSTTFGEHTRRKQQANLQSAPNPSRK